MPLDLTILRSALPGRRLEYLSTVDSTMLVASRLAAARCASGAVVISEEQTEGKGRQGHRWHSEPESGLYLSVVLDVPLASEDLPALTMTIGLATAEAIARGADIACDLRWPNDVLLGGRKCAGILVQLEPPRVIAGVGINVNHQEFPPELDGIATSLRRETGRRQSRETLLIELLGAVDRYRDMLVRGGKQRILDLFARRSSYVQGRRVRVDLGDRVIEGVTAGLDASGFLQVREDGGRLTTVVAGGVRPVEPPKIQQEAPHVAGA